MENISNRTIAGLLIVAMVISLTGTFFSLSKLDAIQNEGLLTGFATNPNATAALEITDLTAIDFIVQEVDWGQGTVNSTDNLFCNLTTVNMSVAVHSSACTDFNAPQPMLVLKNIGNQVVSVTLNTNATPEEWIGDSSGNLYFEVYENLSGSCTGTRAGVDTVLSTGTENLCTEFLFASGSDQLNVPIKVQVPYNVTGAKSVRITATATAV
ncbi:MAG: hypothetical protein ACMXYL_03825 [Candidatus Woesearchaeota archaeon]